MDDTLFYLHCIVRVKYGKQPPLYGLIMRKQQNRSRQPGNIIVLGEFRTWTGKLAMFKYLAISPKTRMYQYSRSEGLFVGLGLTYIGSFGSDAHSVLTMLAW